MAVKTLDDVKGVQGGSTPNPWGAAGGPSARPGGAAGGAGGMRGGTAAPSSNFTTAGGYTPIPDQQSMGGLGAGDVFIDCCGETVPASSLSAWQLPLAMCCPCCIGDPCSGNRRAWYLSQLKSFMGVISCVEILVFLGEVYFSGTWSAFLSVPTNTLVMMGGKVAGLIASGEYWRLVTPVILHSGIMHVTINVFVQCMFGIQLEREWGSAQVALIYLAGGIYGNILSVLFSPGSVSIGCSGAIFGLFGAQVAYILGMWKSMGDLQKKMLTMSLGISALFICIFSFSVGVDMSAHLGGFLVGIVIGLGYFSHLWGEKHWWYEHGKVLAYGAAASTTALALVYFWHNPELGYNTKVFSPGDGNSAF